GGEILYRRKPGAGAGSGRGKGRYSGCRYLRPVYSKHAGRGKPASNLARWDPHGADHGARSGDQLHRLPGD
ncbi:protein mrp, partial [Enterobacter roggenkampii]